MRERFDYIVPHLSKKKDIMLGLCQATMTRQTMDELIKC